MYRLVNMTRRMVHASCLWSNNIAFFVDATFRGGEHSNQMTATAGPQRSCINRHCLAGAAAWRAAGGVLNRVLFAFLIDAIAESSVALKNALARRRGIAPSEGV